MLRLNNKDYTVEQLERLIYLVSVIAKDTALNEVEIKEVKDLIDGTEFVDNKGGRITVIPWSFKFEILIDPKKEEIAQMILNAMRSPEVNESIKHRFSNIVREEVNWYVDKVKYFVSNGEVNML